MVILHHGKKSLFWSLIIFGYLSFITVRGQKIGFNSCECVKFVNIANFHASHVWGKRISSCNDTTFFLHIFSFFCFRNAISFHSGYVFKPLQPSSAIYEPPPFAGHRYIVGLIKICKNLRSHNITLLKLTQSPISSWIFSPFCFVFFCPSITPFDFFTPLPLKITPKGRFHPHWEPLV